jgi:DNA polymerase III alpha subunit
MTSLTPPDLSMRLAIELGTGSLDDRAALHVLTRPIPLGNGVAAAYLDRRSGEAATDFERLILADKADCHVTLRKALDPTFGLILYREQILALAESISGFEPGELRRLWLATAKLGGPEADELRRIFVSQRSSPWAHDEVARVWDLIVAASPVVVAAGDAYRAASRSMADERVDSLWPTNLHAQVHGAI